MDPGVCTSNQQWCVPLKEGGRHEGPLGITEQGTTRGRVGLEEGAIGSLICPKPLTGDP